MLTPPFAKHTVAFTTNSVPCIITPPLFEKIQELRPLDDLKSADAQAQVSLILSIPNYLPSRQGKSLDYEWVSILDVVVFKAPHRPFKRRTGFEGI